MKIVNILCGVTKKLYYLGKYPIGKLYSSMLVIYEIFVYYYEYETLPLNNLPRKYIEVQRFGIDCIK